MLVIRYLRIGKKNQPSFKIVVTDKRKAPRGGRSVEVLGFNNPLTKKKSIDKERALYWISKGAQPSVSIHNLLVEMKIIEGKKIATHAKSKKEAAPASAPAPAQVAPAAPVEAPATPSPEVIAATPAPAPDAPKEFVQSLLGDKADKEPKPTE